MINILFIAVRWYNYNKDTNVCWLSDVYHNFYSSFNSTGLGHYKVFEYDYQKEMNIDLDKSLVDLCKYNKFDVIIFLSYFEKFGKFTDNTWNYIKNELNIPIVCSIGDYYPERENYDYLKYADLVVYHDTDKGLNTHNKDNSYFFLAFPQDFNLFYSSDIIRDTPIIFPGSYSSVERRELVSYLYNLNLPVTARGGKIDAIWGGWHCASPLEYAIDHMRSKLSICLTHEYSKDYVIGHIPESMFCGCCTFINESRIVETLFKKGVHYVEFTDKYDLADKLIYYLDNEDEATKIAKNGHIEIQKYNAYNFYKKIFDKLGIRY